MHIMVIKIRYLHWQLVELLREGLGIRDIGECEIPQTTFDWLCGNRKNTQEYYLYMFLRHNNIDATIAQKICVFNSKDQQKTIYHCIQMDEQWRKREIRLTEYWDIITSQMVRQDRASTARGSRASSRMIGAVREVTEEELQDIRRQAQDLEDQELVERVELVEELESRGVSLTERQWSKLRLRHLREMLHVVRAEDEQEEEALE